MDEKDTSSKTKQPKFSVRRDVFISGIIVFAIAAIVGIVNNQALTAGGTAFFNWSLDNFGWLYQLTVMGSTLLVIALIVSKVGNIRLGGPDAKPDFSFGAWFAMSLTGGISTGLVTYGLNEPMIYFGNVWGELDTLGITPMSADAAHLAIGRSIMNWSFLPYGLYALCAILISYLHYNKKQKLNVTATLKPLFGDRIAKGALGAIVDTLAMLALGVGLCGALAATVSLIISGLSTYGIRDTVILFVIIGVIITLLFTFSSSLGMARGLQVIGSINAWVYGIILLLLLLVGPTVYIFRETFCGLAMWFHNFLLWGLDPGDIGGAALTRSWTLFDWSAWVAYAPVTGIFLAMMSKGRTIRETLIVNWCLPALVALVWFGVWGSYGIDMQVSGTADIVDAIQSGGAFAGLWEFLRHLPFGLGTILIPVNLVVIVMAQVASGDATLKNVGAMCMKDMPIDGEPPVSMKIAWGAVIGTVAVVMAAFGGGVQGIDGIKALASAGGFLVLFIFLMQIASAVKVFFLSDVSEEINSAQSAKRSCRELKLSVDSDFAEE